ncbi:hypothetical protein [Halodurantibacterium flavum]|uniref:Uncharacterized protein n=1 Tax=Halodurantibacterium flavum TaxID=1382802 RepID=A0ABW4S3P8_9RHOB
MISALMRQDRWLVLSQALFLCLIPAELLLGRGWDAIAALGALGACLIPTALRENTRLDLPDGVDRATALFVTATIFLGERLSFYDLLWWWDLAAHGVAGVLLVLLAALVHDQLQGRRGSEVPIGGPLRMIFILSFSIAAAALWEVLEYSLDVIFDSDAQEDGLDDTMTDILAHVLGSVTAAMLLHRNSNRNSQD